MNFDDVMGIVYEHKHNFIEEAVGIDIEEFVNTLVDIINDYIPSTLQYVDGDILVVNDLWNPVKGTDPKIICH